MFVKLTKTAKAAGLEPPTYLHYLFETLQTFAYPEAIEALMPHRITMGELKTPVLVM